MEKLTRNFAKLVKEYDEELTAFAQSYVKNLPVAEELVSDVFYKLWEKRNTLHEIENKESYLYKATKNQCLNYLKSRFNRADLQTDHPESLDFLIDRLDPEAELLNRELQQVLDATIEKLPHSCKNVFVLVKGRGMSHKQVAETLGISAKTVENQITKAIKKLRGGIEEYRQEKGKQRPGSNNRQIAISITLAALTFFKFFMQ